ncbi:MAG TPA: formate dehydrogenase accessory sulfurtransferase FdhD [Thermoanaerobaculia bacterium]|nr:formate dehydrogenase accessory sulfurtransferase FdhD [Thermoanaerobaculia bacterium]
MTRIHRIDASGATEVDDALVVEEPLEIRVNDRAVSVTLRTPGDDFDLAAGFLFTESILRSAEEVAELRHWGSPNVVRVALRDGVRVDLARLQRNFYSASSCGVCGKASIDAIRVQTNALQNRMDVPRDVIVDLPAKLRDAQKTFDATGAIHGAGIFSADGTLLCAREDVGRHNAVDKVIGSFFREGGTLSEKILVVSGRASFEIVQKAIVARIPVLAAVGAPSTLAVELAREMGLTLYGFVRDGRFNAYA